MAKWSLGKLEFKHIAPIVKNRFNSDVFKPGSYWTILWVDKIYLNFDNNLVYDAVVTEVKDFESKKFNLKRLNFSNSQVISLPARLMRIIPPGTIIKDGMLLFKRHHKYFKKSTVLVSPDCPPQEFYKWKYYRDLRTFLHFNEFKIRGSKGSIDFGAYSKVVVVEKFSFPKVGGNEVISPGLPVLKEYVVFPCFELARFYWFTSTKMMEVLFKAGEISKHKNQLWNPLFKRVPDSENQYHYLRLRDEMYLRDVHVISRIAFSDRASASAKAIPESMVNRVHSDEGGDENSFFVKTFFPFETPSEVKFLGIEFDCGPNTKIKLVLEILQCSGEWPFKSLRYDRESETIKEDLTKEIKGEQRTFNSKVRNEQRGPNPMDPEDWFEDGKYDPLFDLDNLSLDESQLNNRGIKHAIIIDKGKRFKTLPQDIERMARIKEVPPKKKLPPKTRLVKNLSTNENKTGNSDSTGADVATEETGDHTPKSKGTLSKLMLDMEKRFIALGANVRYHNLKDEYGQKSLIAIRLLPDQKSTTRERSFTKRGNGDRFIILQYVEHEEGCFVICELQPNPKRTTLKVIHKRKAQEGLKISKYDMSHILIALVKSLGKNTRMKDYKIFELKHGSKAGPGYADKILERIKYNNNLDSIS